MKNSFGEIGMPQIGPLHLPITVRLTLRFLVGEFRKSTRHRYIPSSDNLILSIFSCEGWLAVLKKARGPNTVGEDHSFACVNCLPRTSKLTRNEKNGIEFIIKPKYNLRFHIQLQSKASSLVSASITQLCQKNLLTYKVVRCRPLDTRAP